jgi:hypothetical protein
MTISFLDSRFISGYSWITRKTPWVLPHCAARICP